LSIPTRQHRRSTSRDILSARWTRGFPLGALPTGRHGVAQLVAVYSNLARHHLRRRNNHKSIAIHGRQRNDEPGFRTTVDDCL
jgi:hypothetical protein